MNIDASGFDPGPKRILDRSSFNHPPVSGFQGTSDSFQCERYPFHYFRVIHSISLLKLFDRPALGLDHGR